MQSLSDAFRPKASLTLQKRSLSLQVYVVKSYEASLDSPWRLSEEQMPYWACPVELFVARGFGLGGWVMLRMLIAPAWRKFSFTFEFLSFQF